MSWQQWTIVILLGFKFLGGMVWGIDKGEDTAERVGYVLGHWAYLGFFLGVLISGGFFN